MDSIQVVVDVQNSEFPQETRKAKKFKRDSLSKRLSFGLPGSRRHQRWLNQSFLESLRVGDPLEEPGDPVYPQSDGRTPLAQLFEEGNLDVWEQFISMTEDEQNKLMSNLLNISEVEINAQQQEKEVTPKSMLSRHEIEEMISRSFKDVRPRKAKLLKNTDFLSDLERRILEYLTISEGERLIFEEQFLTFSSSSSPFFESAVHMDPPPAHMEVFFNDNFQRMLAHGLCRLYSLESASAQSGPRSPGKRVTIINKSENFSVTSLPPFSLGAYLSSTRKAEMSSC